MHGFFVDVLTGKPIDQLFTFLMNFMLNKFYAKYYN